MPNCCICGRPLPNRYAIAGKCEDDGCDAVFCALHWNNGNRRCGNHGWNPGGILERGASETAAQNAECKMHEAERAMAMEGDGKMADDTEAKAAPAAREGELREKARKLLTAEQAKGILRAVADFAGKMGHAASALVMKIKNEKSPDALLVSIDASLEANKAQRAPLMARADALFAEIAAKKKIYQAAPPARKKLLELELKSLLSEYKGIERQMTAFFENENTLNTVRGRVLELMALGMRKIDEKTIDKLTDDIEEAVGESEDVAGAVRDLDKAGKRRENESDQESFESALSGFDDEGAAFAATAPESATTDPFAVEPPLHAVAAVGGTSSSSEPPTPVADEP